MAIILSFLGLFHLIWGLDCFFGLYHLAGSQFDQPYLGFVLAGVVMYQAAVSWLRLPLDHSTVLSCTIIDPDVCYYSIMY